MKVHIHGNCQSYVLGGMLGEVFPHWDITSSQVHTDEIVAQNEEYRQQVSTADLVLVQPIHRGYRGREDLSLDWVRGAVRDDAMLLVIPSMHFTGHHPTDADLGVTGLMTGDSIVATLVAGGIDPDSVGAIMTSPDLLSDHLVKREIAFSIAEMARREVEDKIDIRFSPFLETDAERGQLFHFVNHPFKQVYVFVLNQILTRLGFSRRVLADGKRWQEALHIPLLPAVQSYLTHLAGVASDGTDSDEEAVLLPGREPMTQRQYFQAMAARLVECPAGELLAAVHGRSWPRDFLGRFTAAVTGGLSPAADALTPGERIEAARQLAAEIARLAHRNLAPRKIMGATIADPATAAAGVPVAEMAQAMAKALDAQQRGDWAAAAGLWARIRTLAPNEPAGYGFGAEMAKNLGQVAEADDILAVGVNRFPTDHGLAADFANMAAHRRAWGEALTRWSQFRSRFPAHPAGFVGAAWAFREQGQLDLAEVLLGEAVQRFPDQKLFVYKLAYATLTGDELAQLHAAVRGYGPAPLLYVRYANTEHPDGTVERVTPGLLVGYLDHFGAASDGQSLTSPVDSWGVICERAYDLWNSGGDEGVDDDRAPAAAPLPMIGNPVTQPPVRWEPDLIARMQAEADDLSGHPINRRLRDIMARAGRGEPVAGLRRRLEDVATEYPAAYLSDPWFYDNYALTCMTAGAFDLASSLVRDRFRADWACEPVIEAGGNPAPVMRWNVVSRSHSRFLFEPAAFAGEITVGVLLSWARSMPLYDGYHRSDELACGMANVSLFDAGIAPGIAFCGNRPDHLLVPDMEYLYRDGHSAVRAEIDAHSQPWEQRQPVAYWRGSTTGHWDGKDWHTLPRIRLCDIGAGSGGLIDAGLSGIVQMEPQVAGEIAGSGLLKGSVPPARFADYRCLIDIDGNSNSWSGLFYRLYTGSTVLKVDSPFNFRLWFYDRLVPWHNYVPVASDMSDLLEKVEWLLRNDEVARDIGRRGRELAVSLDYETEVMGAARTITAALRQDAFLRSR